SDQGKEMSQNRADSMDHVRDLGIEYSLLLGAGHDWDVIQNTLKAGLDIDSLIWDVRGEYAETFLHKAAAKGNEITVKKLLRRRANLRAQTHPWSYTPLHCCAETDKIENALLLIHAGAQIDAQGKHGDTPLHRASLHGGA